ncbi:DUF2207 domain-containing protein [Intestinibacter sp.]
MKKYRKISIMFSILFFLLIFLQPVYALEEDAFAHNGYLIQNMDIQMKINEDNSFDITEEITADMQQPKHGIIRKIPTKNTVVRTDGTMSNNRAKITNVKVSEKTSTSKENGYLNLKIGDPNTTIKGLKTYTISYNYSLGKDPLKNADEFYFNIVGDQWDTSIQHVTFHIQMPKEFDDTLLGFSSGTTGSTASNIIYTVEGRTISGETTTVLHPYEAATIRLTLPEGYFKYEFIDTYSIFVIALAIISIIFGIILWIKGIILWIKGGTKEHLTIPVRFYPPEGFNSAEIEYIYKGASSDDGAMSLLLSLANEGYLEIDEFQEYGYDTFQLIQKKNYENKKGIEALFMKGLFSKSSVVSEDDLKNKFYKTIKKIKSQLNTKKNHNMIFEQKTFPQKIVVPLAILLFVLSVLKPIVNDQGFENSPFVLVFSGIGDFVLLYAILNHPKNRKFLILLGLLFGSSINIMIFNAIMNDPMYLITFGICLLSIVILLIVNKTQTKRTQLGKDLYAEIEGFKRFLEKVEKPKLEALVMEHPNYFYDILPYTYALGISNKWVEKFDDIAAEPATWYHSHHSMHHFMHHTMRYMNQSMTSKPSISSNKGYSGGGDSCGGGYSGGGGDSCGGSSGGGSGGGGGSSW